MKKVIKKTSVIFGVVITLIIGFIIWSRMESVKDRRLINEFNEKIRKGELIERESVKLHIGDFMLFKIDKDIFAVKIMDLKTSGFDYQEAFFECYSLRLSTHTSGKVRKFYHKKNEGYYEDTSNSDRFIECGTVLFDWSPGDEHDYVWLAIEKIISGPPILEYSLTNKKDISMIDFKSQSLKWQPLKK